jgi:hypothetical protein
MRFESSVTSISWIPSDVVAGLPKVGFRIGAVHYDDPPPDVLDDLDKLFAAERFRFANRLTAWIEVEDGRVMEAGYSGRGYMSQTRVRLGSKTEIVFQPAEFSELKSTPEVTDSGARFVQTTGGRTGMPAPRPAKRKPFFQWVSPTVWTTLALTIKIDGSTEYDLIGASRFPRHWVYDGRGQLVSKSALAASSEWMETSFGPHSPWGSEDVEPLLSAVGTALERELSTSIMREGVKPSMRKIRKGSWLTRQGDLGNEVYLLLNGALAVWVDGEELGELGPGAVVGERAVLESGKRTASLCALTDCIVAVAAAGQLDQDKLRTLAAEHQREETGAKSRVTDS